MQKKNIHIQNCTQDYTATHHSNSETNKMSLMLTARVELRKCLSEEMTEGERDVERERENAIGEKFR